MDLLRKTAREGLRMKADVQRAYDLYSKAVNVTFLLEKGALNCRTGSHRSVVCFVKALVKFQDG